MTVRITKRRPAYASDSYLRSCILTYVFIFLFCLIIYFFPSFFHLFRFITSFPFLRSFNYSLFYLFTFFLFYLFHLLQSLLFSSSLFNFLFLFFSTIYFLFLLNVFRFTSCFLLRFLVFIDLRMSLFHLLTNLLFHSGVISVSFLLLVFLAISFTYSFSEELALLILWYVFGPVLCI